mgnify:CR=1 FL=1
MCHLNHYFFINRSRRIEKIYIYTCYLLANPPHKLLPTVEECRKQEGIRKDPCERTCKARRKKSEYRNQTEPHQGSCCHLADSGQDRKGGKAHSLNGEADDINEG